MKAVLFVGLGGFVGAVCRYLLSLVPWRGDLPLTTLAANFLGAVVIGALVAFSARILPLPPGLLLFLRTGVCGGFTTFSTFSLETVALLEGGQVRLGILYAVGSVLLCLGGIFLGRWLIGLFATA